MSTRNIIDKLTEVLAKYNFHYYISFETPEEHTLAFYHNTTTLTLLEKTIKEVRKIVPKAKWKIKLHKEYNALCLGLYIRRQE